MNMDIKIQAKAAEHLYHIISKKPFEPAVAFMPRKKVFRKCAGGRCLPRKTPEQTGVSSKLLCDFLNEIQASKASNAHQVMVIKDGAVICEAGLAPFLTDIWHVTHSMCKTVTAMAIGILVTDGKLSVDEKIVRIFDKYCSPIAKMRLGKVTVRHLLTMSSGVALNEDVIPAESDWLKAYLDSSCRFEPGTRFSYNSINSYVLSCIVQEITGVTLFDFLKVKLFEPMGICNIQWESCPMGRTKGGWGMYITPEDMGKLGILLLNKGCYNGRRLIGSEYIDDMTKKHMETPDDESAYGYGYHIWMGRRPGSFLFNGMLGQNIHCMPDVNMVVVVTGGNDKLFGKCEINEIIYKYFAEAFNPNTCLPEDEPHFRALKNTQRSMRNPVYDFKKDVRKGKLERIAEAMDRAQLPKEAEFLDGREYQLDKVFVRFLPIFAQVLNNSYSAGVSRIAFEKSGNRFYVKITEGDHICKVAVGFKNFDYTNVDINGEPYIIAAKGMFTYDEDSNPVLKISMPFIEHSNGRILKIYFLENGMIKTLWQEFPGSSVLIGGMKAFMGGMSDMVTNQINAMVDMDMLVELGETLMEPVVMGRAVKGEKSHGILHKGKNTK